jgi:excisionase family DNA binding protein
MQPCRVVSILAYTFGEKTMDLDTWITVREAAQLAGYSTEYLRELIRDHKIDAKKAGFQWMVKKQSLEAYLNREKGGRDDPR